MKPSYRWTACIAAALAVVALAGCEQDTTAPTADATAASFGKGGKGNGAPTGKHYNLNIIGVQKDKTADMDATSSDGIGNRIFVALWSNDGSQNWSTVAKKNKIYLTPGDFGVLDANATDQDGAVFSLPPDVSYEYEVWARALGKPGGSSTTTTCAIDATGEIYCSIYNWVALRTKGKQSFENVSSELLSGTYLIDPEDDPDLAACFGIADTPDFDDPAVEVTTGLFDPCFQGYFWDYDNNGLKLLQLRFYPV
ncbi:MAG: hypothetical protein ACE5JR_06495 [Gemmatimonadota bacterium]